MGSSARTYPFVPAGSSVLTVSKLTLQIGEKLETSFPTVWVEGEITDFTCARSGNLFFTLKDAKASLRCIMNAMQVFRLPAGWNPEDGNDVVAYGRLSVYASRGDYQLQVERLIPTGLGEAELALRQLKEKLAGLGYFEPRRKKPLLRFPRSVCLITSPTGDAVRDIIKVMRQRWPATRVGVLGCRVQGEGAAEEVAAAIRQVNTWRARGLTQVDAIIIGRGGGRSDDLAAFNDEQVANAIFSSRIPIISAIGHEADWTIADLVADHRAATPSNAAQIVVPDRLELLEQINGQAFRLHDSMRRLCIDLRRQLDSIARRRIFERPGDRIRDAERLVDDTGERLRRAMQHRLERANQQAKAAAAHLESLSPLNILARGYSLTKPAGGGPLLRDAAAVAVGDRLETRLQRGKIVSRVESVEPEHKGKGEAP